MPGYTEFDSFPQSLDRDQDSRGREYHLRSLQSLALYAANSIFTSGYLTTKGQGTEQDFQMIRDIGFEVDAEKVHKMEATL